MDSNHQVLTTRQVAKMLGFSHEYLRKMRATGTGIPYIRIGTQVRYLQRDIEDFLEQNRVNPDTIKNEAQQY